MRRMLFTLAAGVSAVLCAGVCVLWFRSSEAGWSDEFVLSTPSKSYGVLSVDGSIFAAVYWNVRDPNPPVPSFSIGSDHGMGLGFFCGVVMYNAGRHWGGFGICRLDDNSGGSLVAIREVMVPHWFLAILATLPVVAWVRARLRQRLRASRVKQCRCPACGYDLRATPDRCPECGTAAGGVVR